MAHLLERRRRTLPDPRDHRPAGFERFFQELSDLGGAINVDPDELAALGARYGHYFKLDSIPELLGRFDLRIGEPLPGGWTP